ncbi:ribonuclease [Listeria floridensis FSL S10-1187]|uniref:Ribonuclease n=1 Tax=Listeria floridensis FSL S10-1187 TaxID=1265817 RepID=A0ABP3B034_9LIST|nr:hypothetical protein [Listeria floridensis]EUJ33240.1 ribonuclease [Listeria floridensis FSL S10-1187]
MTETCPVCRGTGHVTSALSTAYELERELEFYQNADSFLVVTTEAVLDVFLGLDQASKYTVDWEIADEAAPFYAIRRAD